MLTTVYLTLCGLETPNWVLLQTVKTNTVVYGISPGSALFAKTKKERNTILCLEITAYDISIYTMDRPDFIVCSFMEIPLVLNWLKRREQESK